VNGLLVPPDDPEALCAALEKLVSDPTFRYNMARAAWDKAKKVYSLQRVIAQLKSVYAAYRTTAVIADSAAAGVEQDNADGPE